MACECVRLQRRTARKRPLGLYYLQRRRSQKKNARTRLAVPPCRAAHSPLRPAAAARATMPPKTPPRTPPKTPPRSPVGPHAALQNIDVLCLVLKQLAASHRQWAAECERSSQVCQLWRACARRVRNSLEQWEEHSFLVTRFSTRRWPRRARTMEQGEVRPSPPLLLPTFTTGGVFDWQLAVYNPAVDHRGSAVRRPPGAALTGGLAGAALADSHCLGLSLRVPSAETQPAGWARRTEAFLAVHPPHAPGETPPASLSIHLRHMLRRGCDEAGPAWCVRAAELAQYLHEDDSLRLTVRLRVTPGSRTCTLGDEAHPLARDDSQRREQAPRAPRPSSPPLLPASPYTHARTHARTAATSGAWDVPENSHADLTQRTCGEQRTAPHSMHPPHTRTPCTHHTLARRPILPACRAAPLAPGLSQCPSLSLFRLQLSVPTPSPFALAPWQAGGRSYAGGRSFLCGRSYVCVSCRGSSIEQRQHGRRAAAGCGRSPVLTRLAPAGSLVGGRACTAAPPAATTTSVTSAAPRRAGPAAPLAPLPSPSPATVSAALPSGAPRRRRILRSRRRDRLEHPPPAATPRGAQLPPPGPAPLSSSPGPSPSDSRLREAQVAFSDILPPDAREDAVAAPRAQPARMKTVSHPLLDDSFAGRRAARAPAAGGACARQAALDFPFGGQDRAR